MLAEGRTRSNGALMARAMRETLEAAGGSKKEKEMLFLAMMEKLHAESPGLPSDTEDGDTTGSTRNKASHGEPGSYHVDGIHGGETLQGQGAFSSPASRAGWPSRQLKILQTGCLS